MVCLGWFVLSLASKPAAVIFPIVLFLFDAWYRRPVKARVFLEKIPFLLLAGLVGYLTLEGQTAANATDMKDAFDLGNRVQFFFYGFGAYLLKMLAPINLVAFYPFPSVKEALPIAYMLAPVLFVAVAGLCWAARRKYPIVSFGFGFYLLNLLLVLQLITVGHAIIADRYTYIPYIGLFLILAWFVRDWFAGNPAKGLVTVTGLGLILAVVSIFQASTWSNDLALWDNAIQKNPSYMAYCLRGNARQAGGQNDGAMKDYDMALSLRPDYVPALDNRGTLLVRTGKMDQAMADFNLAIQLQQTYKPARMNRATAFMESGNMEAALRDLGQLIRGDADDAEIYNTMGICYQRMAQFDQSIHPFSQAIQLSKTPGTYYLNRSYSWNALGWPENARRDAKEAQKANVTIPSDYAKQIGL
jgi:Tfp pilus assembly protein PilF